MVLYLDSTGTWRNDDGTVATFELPAGEAFLVGRHAGTDALVTFTGELGNDGTQTNRVVTGWNMLGLSEGIMRGITETFAGGSNGGPFGAPAEEFADVIAIEQPDGSWKRYLYVTGWGPPFDGTWVDLDTGLISNPAPEPGQGYYYFRQDLGGDMEVTF